MADPGLLITMHRTQSRCSRHLKNREIYAEASTRYRNPQARLLDGAVWAAVKTDVLTTSGLPKSPMCSSSPVPSWGSAVR
ncbi:hypothetical protein [Streptosporangium roseum]|uniref:hypothetical protein n=1 Tax=Streptosporangium roseum TaxID=2001 RepID=UPI0033186692